MFTFYMECIFILLLWCVALYLINRSKLRTSSEYAHQLLQLEQLAQSIAQVFGLERRIIGDHAEWTHPEHHTSLPGRLVDMKITVTSGSGLTVRCVDKTGDTRICAISVQQWAELDKHTREALQLGMIEQYKRYHLSRGSRIAS